MSCLTISSTSLCPILRRVPLIKGLQVKEGRLIVYLKCGLKGTVWTESIATERPEVIRVRFCLPLSWVTRPLLWIALKFHKPTLPPFIEKLSTDGCLIDFRKLRLGNFCPSDLIEIQEFLVPGWDGHAITVEFKVKER